MIFITFPFLLHLILYLGFSVSLLIRLSFILFFFKRDFLWASSHWRTQDFVKVVFSYIAHSSLPLRQFILISYIMICWKNIQLLFTLNMCPMRFFQVYWSLPPVGPLPSSAVAWVVAARTIDSRISWSLLPSCPISF